VEKKDGPPASTAKSATQRGKYGIFPTPIRPGVGPEGVVGGGIGDTFGPWARDGDDGLVKRETRGIAIGGRR